MTEMYEPSKLSPASGSQSAPTSGRYGDQIELDRLQSGMRQPRPTAPSPSEPSISPGPALMPSPPPSGPLPRSLTAPTTRPNEPISTPLTPDEPIAELPPMQRTQLLEAVARDPTVSETTRRFALTLLQARQQ